MIMDPIQKDSIQQVLCKALEEISMEKQYQEKCLLLLIDVLQPYEDSTPEKRQNSGGTERFHKLSKYQSMVSSVLMATLPPHFSEICHNIMLTNLGSMKSGQIHNNLKKFCVADPRYDKSLQQLESFLSGLVAEDKLELDGRIPHQKYAICKCMPIERLLFVELQVAASMFGILRCDRLSGDGRILQMWDHLPLCLKLRLDWNLQLWS